MGILLIMHKKISSRDSFFEKPLIKSSIDKNSDDYMDDESDLSEDLSTSKNEVKSKEQPHHGRIINLPDGMAVNFRESPSEFGAIKKKLINGEEIIFLNKKEPYRGMYFFNISVDGDDGWVASNFIEYYDGNKLIFRGVKPSFDKPKPPEDNTSTSWQVFVPKMAKNIYDKFGIPESITISQFALESNFGTRESGSFNFFGIKSKPTESSVTLKTTEEFTPGKKESVSSGFRNFDSIENAFNSYGELLSTNPRYSFATKTYQQDPAKFIIWIWANGYATDSKYPIKISGISKSVASKLQRQDLAFDFNSNLLNIIDYLGSLPPEQRSDALLKIMNKNKKVS